MIGDTTLKVGVMTVSGWYQVELEHLIDDLDKTYSFVEKPETFTLNDTEFPLPIESHDGVHKLTIGSREFPFKNGIDLTVVEDALFRLLDGRM
jgi:hypothetical protein